MVGALSQLYRSSGHFAWGAQSKVYKLSLKDTQMSQRMPTPTPSGLGRDSLGQCWLQKGAMNKPDTVALK